MFESYNLNVVLTKISNMDLAMWKWVQSSHNLGMQLSDKMLELIFTLPQVCLLDRNSIRLIIN